MENTTKAQDFPIPEASEPASTNATFKDDYAKGAADGAVIKTQEASFSKSRAKGSD